MCDWGLKFSLLPCIIGVTPRRGCFVERIGFMERFILKKLLDWKKSPYRKPLILKGVRQVGKTWILKEFGKRYYENVAYFNFDETRNISNFLRPPRTWIAFCRI